MEYKTPTESAIPMTLIPAIETAFGEALLPILFASQCATTGAIDLATGLSISPKDKIVSGTLCKNQKDKENLCLVYAGKMTVYYEAATLNNTKSVKTTLLNELKAGMTKGDFLSAHDGLERIGYIAAKDDGVEEEKKWLDWIRGLIESEDKTQLFIIAGGAIVGILGCGLCILFLRNRE
jgi:hypothetical protein